MATEPATTNAPAEPMPRGTGRIRRDVRWVLYGSFRGPSTCSLSRELFLRLLGLVYLIAFVSLAVQVRGLIGESGILPAAEYLEAIRQRLGPERFLRLPTIAWWFHSDAALTGICWIGAALSVVLVIGAAPLPVLALLWTLYLSICSVGRDFLHFQWDTLLLETGLLALFVAPWRLRPSWRNSPPPSPGGVFLLRWLLFRLMFLSGAVKLASGDTMWHGLTALTVHYETQPLPAWTSWYAHNLPLPWHRFSCAVMFFIELALPFCIWGPRGLRAFAAAGFGLLMLLIGLTGNYNFFNLLTCALCLFLLDDALLAGAIPKKSREQVVPAPQCRLPARWTRWPMAAVVVAVASITLVEGLERLWRRREQPPIVAALVARFDPVREKIFPFRSFNSYGLFAGMTVTRPEIVIEGSDDGQSWFVYSFRWKPGDLSRPPAFVQPHQPRLDWQMWFAALRPCNRTPWFQQFLHKLLEGSPDVLALLESNPFPDHPPKQIRALLYRYRFTDPETRAATGHWWQREYLGFYCRPVSLPRKGNAP